MKKVLFIICFISIVNHSEAQQRWSSAFIGKPSTRALYASNVAKAIQNAWENELTTKDKKDALLDEIVFGTNLDFRIRQDITDNSDKSITSNIDEIEEISGIVEVTKTPINKDMIVDNKKIAPEINTTLLIADETFESDTIYAFPQTPALFTGGQNTMKKFFEKNIQVPKTHGEVVQGKVLVKFMVNKNGELSHIYLQKGLTEACNKEALRVVKLMPAWIPAIQDGKIVNSWHTLPINFKIE